MLRPADGDQPCRAEFEVWIRSSDSGKRAGGVRRRG